MPSAASPDAASLWRALTRIPPRSAQLLMFRFVDGRSPAECMALYGIAPDALEIHLLRAASLLWEAARPERRSHRPVLPSDVPVLPREEERRWARQLVARLAGAKEPAISPEREADAQLERLAGMLELLRQRGLEVRALAEQSAREELESPSARRADLLRRMALLALIGLAVWLYLRNGR
ncbi:MAG: hypothetical protein WBV82_25190 [Myxococcaceae bacterium]